MKLNIIFARSLNGVIGIDNTIPWSIPEDMKRFKELTTGCPVIMGRKTWESLPHQFQPLPNRSNIVLTTNIYYEIPSGVSCYTNLREALESCKSEPNVWIIGGKRVYEDSLQIADTIEETVVGIECEGDTYMSKITSDWSLVSTREILSVKSGIRATFNSYKKN